MKSEVFMKIYSFKLYERIRTNNSLEHSSKQLWIVRDYIYNRAIYELPNQIFYWLNFSTTINDSTKFFRLPEHKSYKLHFQILKIKIVLFLNLEWSLPYSRCLLFHCVNVNNVTHILQLAAIDFLLETSSFICSAF